MAKAPAAGPGPAAQGPATGEPGPAGEGRRAPTLAVSGIVLSKAQLMDALRPYLPTISDVRVDSNGEHFTLLFADDAAQSPAGS